MANPTSRAARTLIRHLEALAIHPDDVETAGQLVAPLIDELSVALECRLKDYNPETCILRGEIVNVSVDERALDEQGKVDPAKVAPICFAPFNNTYLKIGEKVSNAFADGKLLK